MTPPADQPIAAQPVRPAHPTPSARVSGRMDLVARIAVVGMSIGMATIVARVAQLQLAPSAQLQEHRQERLTAKRVPATRGDLLDRRSRLLAATRFGYRVFVDPVELGRARADEAIAALSEALGTPADEIADDLLRAIARNEAIARAAGTPLPPGAASEPDRRSATNPGNLALASLETHDAGASAPSASTPTGASAPVAPASPRKPVRYVRVSGVVSDATAEHVRHLAIPGVHLEEEPVREYPSDGLAAAIVGKVNYAHAGDLGAERRYDASLTGRDGRLEYVRDAFGRPLWINPDGYRSAQRGEDIRLSIDLELQRIAETLLARGIEDANAAGGRIVVFDPLTGEVLALADIIRDLPELVDMQWEPKLSAKERAARTGALYEPSPSDRGPRPRYRIIPRDPARAAHPDIPAMFRNRCIEDIYEPGSTFKPLVWACVTSLAGVPDSHVFQTQGSHWRTSYNRLIHDVHPHASQSWREVLINSSNIGMSQSVELIERTSLRDYVRALGFGARAGTGLQHESPGRVTPKRFWSKYTQTSVSFGQEIAVTPVQMVRAFSIFARPGELAGTLPAVSLSAIDPDGQFANTSLIARRIVSPSVVLRVRDALRVVASKVDTFMAAGLAAGGRGPEKGWRYSIFGKSGTASVPLGQAPKGMQAPRGMRGYFERQYMSNFIAAAPVENPRLVVLVIIDDPGPELVRKNLYYGSNVAGPVVRRVMEQSLAYLGVPPSPPEMLAPPIESGVTISD